MDSEIDYSKLTISELKILIAADDFCALEEFNKRVKLGEIEPKHYTTDQAGEIVSKHIKSQISSEIDYKKLTARELRHLMGINDTKADEEHHRRVMSGEIKLRRVTFEDIKEMYSRSEDKAS
ncbi:MAG: hypothetical protein HY094_05915 [Candidatus Melainabacteria bacterium]|nr:hypothetical protein [Candidatus Melainabacteria bacterium]